MSINDINSQVTMNRRDLSQIEVKHKQANNEKPTPGILLNWE